MNVTNVEVLHAQIAQTNTSISQMLQMEAQIDLAAQAMTMQWYNISEDRFRSEESFATATVRFENPSAWHTEWSRMTHLVNGRIESLSWMAADGTANKLSKNMTYSLFKNVVDYADKYRGMQSVVLNEHEAYADVALVPERHGKWHTPHHWIDSVFHLAGLIMNGSDASNTKDFFYVTPGWDSCRMASLLKLGAKYRSYVRMFLIDEPNMHAGDVYVLQDDVVVAMMGNMKFRKVPRVLMDKFFSPAATKSSGESAPKRVTPAPAAAAPKPAAVAQKPKTEAPAVATSKPVEKIPAQAPEAPKPATKEAAVPAAAEEGLIADCIKLIARETGLEVEELTDEASFIELGVDSLMSLVLSEKFRSELRLEVKSSIFSECSSIGESKGWLEQFC